LLHETAPLNPNIDAKRASGKLHGGRYHGQRRAEGGSGHLASERSRVGVAEVGGAAVGAGLHEVVGAGAVDVGVVKAAACPPAARADRTGRHDGQSAGRAAAQLGDVDGVWVENLAAAVVDVVGARAGVALERAERRECVGVAETRGAVAGATRADVARIRSGAAAARVYGDGNARDGRVANGQRGGIAAAHGGGP